MNRNKNTKKVALVGDSITEGLAKVGMNYFSYADHLQDLDHKSFEFENFGASGKTAQKDMPDE